MNRISIFLLAVMFAGTVSGQSGKESLAVYVSGSGDENIKKVIGARLVAAITRYSDNYAAVERTADFLAEIRKERDYQQNSDNVDNSQLARLGRQFGVKIVVVADVTDVLGSCFVSARMINVESDFLVMNTAEAEKTLNVASDLVSLAEEVASKLLKGSRAGNGSAASTNAQQVQVLYGYLKVFPEDLGEFSTLPASVISTINSSGQHGYGDWRLPSGEELALMRASKTQIGLRDEPYMTSDERGRGHVRLVSTGKSVAEQQAAKKAADDEEMRKNREQMNSMTFEVATADISRVEADDRESACPSGWRLPTGAEMKIIVSNPLVKAKARLEGSTYWIAGSSKKGSRSEDHGDGRYSPAKKYYLYYEFPAYSAGSNSPTSIRKNYEIQYSGYTTFNSYNHQWDKDVPARKEEVDEPQYLPCRYVRYRTAGSSSSGATSGSSSSASSKSPTDSKEQLKLGLDYYKSENHVEAAKWFLKSAEQGNANAQALLGMSCLLGKGVPRNTEQGVEWLKKAAKQGDDDAVKQLEKMENLGIVSSLPSPSSPTDPKKQNSVGMDYYKSEDYVEAAKWFLKSAEQGNATAQYNLGTMYRSGKGVSKNDEQGIDWLKKAAKQGHEKAIEHLEILDITSY